ncbi:cache domain-containing protein, partial [Helicobacter ibis]
MFRNFSLGTKIIAIVSLSIIFGISILVGFVIFRTSNTLELEAEKLLNSASNRYANGIQAISQNVYSGLISLQGNVKGMYQLHGKVDIEDLRMFLENVLDTNSWTSYGYIHMVDRNQYSDGNPLYYTKNGDFIMVLSDANPTSKGGVKAVNAEPAILSWNSAKRALQDKQESAGTPGDIRISGDTVVGYTVTVPLFDNKDKVIGFVGVVVRIDLLRDELNHPSKSLYKNDQRLLIADNGLIASSPKSEFIGKIISEVNPHPSSSKIVEMQKNKENGIFTFVPASTGEKNIAQLFNFDLWGNSSQYWSMVIIAPETSVSKPLYDLVYTILIVSVAILLAVIIIIYFYVKYGISDRLFRLQNTLFDFFKYVNHETKNVSLSKDITSNDEFGSMAKAINDNIQRTQNAL